MIGFNLLFDIEEMKEKIGWSSEYGEYTVHDYELLFSIEGCTPISEINRLCVLVEKFQGTPVYKELSIIQIYINYHFLGHDMELEGFNLYSVFYSKKLIWKLSLSISSAA